MGAVEFPHNVRLNAMQLGSVLRRQPDEPIAAIAARWNFWHTAVRGVL